MAYAIAVFARYMSSGLVSRLKTVLLIVAKLFYYWTNYVFSF